MAFQCTNVIRNYPDCRGFEDEVPKGRAPYRRMSSSFALLFAPFPLAAFSSSLIGRAHVRRCTSLSSCSGLSPPAARLPGLFFSSCLFFSILHSLSKLSLRAPVSLIWFFTVQYKPLIHSILICPLVGSPRSEPSDQAAVSHS